LEHRIERVDTIPLIIHWLMQMKVHEIIDGIYKPHSNWKGLSYGQLALLFITYVLHSLTHRLSGMEEWVVQHKSVIEKVTGWKLGDKEGTDDRLGIMTEVLCEDEDQSVEFQIQTGRHMIHAYELPTEVGRYDTTSFNVYHDPENKNKGLLNFGHSKNHRPDLLQFKQGLGVLDPAGIPLVTETLPGNKADDRCYVPAWAQMAKTIGHTEFLFIADCKAAALDTRATIDKEKGYYLFPMPMTGNTPEELKRLVLNLPVKPQEILLDRVTDEKGEEPRVVGIGFVVEKEMEEETGFRWMERWMVTRSDAHAVRQKDAFLKRLQKAEEKLNKLKPKKEESFETFRARAEKILKAHNIDNAVSLEVTKSISHIKKYKGKGRPAPNSPYEMIETPTFNLAFKRNESAIEQSLSLAGWRIYVTNTPENRLSLNQSTRYYRNEWLVERGFHRFKKGKIPALPLFLRIPERIKGLMLLLTIALQALTLIEFVARRELAENNETLQGLVPGLPKKKIARPTAERLLARFDNLHLLVQENEALAIGRVLESLTSLQKRILSLLKIPVYLYELYFSEPKFEDSS
jgi:transposase